VQGLCIPVKKPAARDARKDFGYRYAQATVLAPTGTSFLGSARGLRSSSRPPNYA
jgi:hypothetical protein